MHGGEGNGTLQGVYMKKRIKLKGRIKTYLIFSIYLGVLLFVVNAFLFLLDYRAALLLARFTVFYFIVTLALYFYNKPILMNELISFATQYGQIQKRLLRELEIPYALLDDAGKVVWTNAAFETVVHQPKGYSKYESRKHSSQYNRIFLLLYQP